MAIKAFWKRWQWLVWSIAAGVVFGALIAFGAPLVRARLFGPPVSAANAYSPPKDSNGTPVTSCAVKKWPAASLSLTPSIISVKAGDNFTVQVTIHTESGSKGVQFGLEYNPRMLVLQGVDEGTFYKDWATAKGASTVVVRGRGIDANAGHLQTMGIVVVGGPDTGVTGQGVAATLRFQAMTGVSGESALTLGDVEISSFDRCGTARSIDPTSVTDGAVVVGESTQPPPPEPHDVHPHTL